MISGTETKAPVMKNLVMGNKLYLIASDEFYGRPICFFVLNWSTHGLICSPRRGFDF